MNLQKIKIAIFTLLILGLVGSNYSNAQEWARKMFKEYTHDFKDVPLGEVPEYRFEIQNIYNEPMKIHSINSSCGCTVASATKQVLKTWEKGEIVCKFNTPAVGAGIKQATVTVRFAQPHVGEVQLTVRGNIVSGVSLTPNSIEFGQVTDSKMPRKTVRITSSGNPYLVIADVKSRFDHITVHPPRRVGNQGNSVVYELTAELKPSAPKGYNQGELYLIVEENPQNRPGGQRILKQIPVKFNAKVVSPLQVAPEILTLGSLEPQEKVTQKVFLTSDIPFKITDVRCMSNAFSVKADGQKKKSHIVEISYTGVKDFGRHENELSFYTDLDSKVAGKMKAIVDIVDPSSSDAQDE